MNRIVFFLFSIMWLSGFSQNLQSNPWHIDRIIGRDINNIQEFTLQKADTTNRYWAWGNTIRFSPDGIFTCKYSAKCGNDCFPSSIGSYSFSDSSHVTIFLKEFSQDGECAHIHRTIEKTLGTYLIVRKDDGSIKLVKLNE